MAVMRHGGAQNRPGTQFVQEVSDSTKVVRLIPFVFNSDQTYVLEFGDLYMRVIKDGVQQVEASVVITGITQADPAVVTTSGAHGYSNGDEVQIADVVGMSQVNGRNFKVANVTGTTYELQSLASVDIDSTGFTAYSSAGICSKVYEIVTPYVEADLMDLQHVQSADVITIAHPSYAPRDLSRTGDIIWSLDAIAFAAEIGQPTNMSTTATTGTAVTNRWAVTAVDETTGEESLIGTGFESTISAITQANPAIVTTTGAHGFPTTNAVNHPINISGVGGMVEITDGLYKAFPLTATTFELRNISGENLDSTGFTAYTTGGDIAEHGLSFKTAALTTVNKATISWSAVAGAKEYNVYKEVFDSGVYGFLGIAKNTTFSDIGADPDGSDTPSEASDPFDVSGNYPAAVTYAQQRRFFANTTNDPEKVWASRIGNFRNFTSRSPIQDDDSFRFILAGRQVNAVRNMIDLGQLLIFTSGGEWAMEGGPSGIITPTDLNPKQYGYNGSNSLPPLVVGGNALYVQARGSVVKDLLFNDSSQSFKGQDLTIFSAHLFDNFTLTDWAFQQIPHSIVWVVRDDGALLGLTYVREHEMFAWHRHDFEGGTVENVVSVPEGTEDSLYLVIKRTINGRTTRYIERFNSRQVDTTTAEDNKFMDSSLSYDGTHSGSTTMTLSGGTTWAYNESLTLTASAGTFTTGYVGNQIHMVGSDGTIIRFTIDAYSSTTVVTGRPHKTVPAAMQGLAATSWGYAVDTVVGLWHIEGQNVSVLGDGFVVASPNNASHDIITVTNGVAALAKHYVKIHVGLPFICDIETLDIDTPQGETLADKKKIVSEVSLFVEKTRGIWTGGKPPSDDAVDPLEDLYELKIRDDENYDSPVSLATDVVDIGIKPEWNSNGRVFIRQVDPVPMAILAVAPAGLFPFRG